MIETGPTSYKFSYSTGDEGPARIFREEQRNPDGSVVGKYGYIDPNGKLRFLCSYLFWNLTVFQY